ncbi:MAG: S8 family serine peptidase, partial [bacterium]|nr:S8 family serine peptidase [bacterium]
MKKTIIVAMFLLISNVLLYGQKRYEDGVILIQVKQPDIVYLENIRVINGSSAFQVILDQHGLMHSRKLSHVNLETDGWYRLDFPVNSDLKMIRFDLTNCPDIRYVTFNHYGVFYSIPNDNYWSDQWALHRIQMPLAWDISKGDHNILVGIIDTGIEYNHEDLSANMWTNPDEIPGDGLDNDNNGYIDDIHGWDFYSNDDDPRDDSGHDYHGTQVSGIVAAKTYNTIGIAGVAGGWQNQLGVQLIALKITHSSGSYTRTQARDAVNYLTNLRQRGFTVIANMSFGFEVLDDNEIIDFKQAIEAARDAGVILVAASGNTNTEDPKSPYYMVEDVDSLPAPARWQGVLAIGASNDGATLPDEQRAAHSLYDEENKLLMVAPVYEGISNGLDIYTTYYNNSYRSDFRGTSAASPMVAGVAALMLSLNPELAWGDIAEILARTADKIANYPAEYSYTDYGERNIEVGYGRLNAYQALLLTLCHTNKSHSSLATAYNNGRRLIRDDNNCYHLVYQSGGEIFYRRSDPGGNSWETSLRLSTGNDENEFPAISGTSSNQFVVWQRYNGTNNGQHQYDTYFAEIYPYLPELIYVFTKKIPGLSNLTFSTQQNPLPVISYKTRCGGYRLLVCSRTNNGIGFCYSDDGGSTWSSASTLTGTSSSHQNPSLSMGPTTPNSTVYLTYDNGSNIYLVPYITSWGSAASVPAGTATQNSKNASLEVDADNGINVAWEGRKRFGNKQIIFHRRKYNDSWQTATYFESSTANYYRPSITGHDNNKRTLVWYSDGGAVYHAYYDGSDWSEFGGMTDTWLQHANISAGTTTAKFVSTGGLTSPYTIYLSSETFPPPGGLSKIASGNSVTDGDLILTPLNVIYHRSASLHTDNEESSLWLELGEIAVKDVNERYTAVDLITLDEKSLNITTKNVFDHLQSEPFELAADAQTIKWVQKIYFNKIDKLLHQD